MANFSDSFTRADNADLGDDWAPQVASNAQIVNNRVRVATLGRAEEVVTAISPAPYQFARIVIATFTGAGIGDVGVNVHCAAPGTRTYYQGAAQKNVAGVTSEISKRIAGVFTSLVTENATTWTAGNTLELVVVPNTPSAGVNRLVLKRNGNTVLTVDDDELDSGGVGIRMFEDTTLADTEIEEFTGGDFQITPTAGSQVLTGIAPIRVHSTVLIPVTP